MVPSKGRAGHIGTALNRMEFLMSIKTRLAAFALATVAVTGAMVSSSTQAQAKPPHWVGPAIVGAAVVGTAIAVSNDGYYHGYRRCGWAPRYNVFGQYVGSVRVCNF
jgi:hypothetical protein